MTHSKHVLEFGLVDTLRPHTHCVGWRANLSPCFHCKTHAHIHGGSGTKHLVSIYCNRTRKVITFSVSFF